MKKVTPTIWLLTVLIAAVMPSFSSATTLKEGEYAPGFAYIAATSEGSVTFTGGEGTWNCTSSSMFGQILKNQENWILLTMTSVSIQGNIGKENLCTGLYQTEGKVTVKNVPWCLSSTGADAWLLRGGGCNEVSRPLVVTIDAKEKEFAPGYVFPAYSCTYSQYSISGFYNTGVTPVTLSSGSNTFSRTEGSYLFCPSSLTLDIKYTLSTAGGGGLQITY
ncbi:MAG TPA: hypothetical protein VNN15_05720 [Solirubrobacterales bacterium]|nr:hypothetical protein [Solirubrobacterales bacterium]